jgi:hypothetical protein
MLSPLPPPFFPSDDDVTAVRVLEKELCPLTLDRDSRVPRLAVEALARLSASDHGLSLLSYSAISEVSIYPVSSIAPLCLHSHEKSLFSHGEV